MKILVAQNAKGFGPEKMSMKNGWVNFRKAFIPATGTEGGSSFLMKNIMFTVNVNTAITNG